MGSKNGGGRSSRMYTSGGLSRKQQDYFDKLVAKGFKRSEASSVVRMFGTDIQAGFKLPEKYRV